MIAIDSVIVVPLVFARPAGLMPIASPLSVDATAAPARDVEIAPEPGRYMPPAIAVPIQNVGIVKAAINLRIVEERNTFDHVVSRRMSKTGGGIVRAPRRPPGWIAPGPQPAGAQGRPELEPEDDEDLCFLTGDWRLFQKQVGHRWSLDDLVTAWIATRRLDPAQALHALDLGNGPR